MERRDWLFSAAIVALVALSVLDCPKPSGPAASDPPTMAWGLPRQ